MNHAAYIIITIIITCVSGEGELLKITASGNPRLFYSSAGEEELLLLPSNLLLVLSLRKNQSSSSETLSSEYHRPVTG